MADEKRYISAEYNLKSVLSAEKQFRNINAQPSLEPHPRSQSRDNHEQDLYSTNQTLIHVFDSHQKNICQQI